MGVPQGTIRATVLLETITAAYEMEEILYELRNHSLGVSESVQNTSNRHILLFKLNVLKSHNTAI